MLCSGVACGHLPPDCEFCRGNCSVLALSATVGCSRDVPRLLEGASPGCCFTEDLSPGSEGDSVDIVGGAMLPPEAVLTAQPAGHVQLLMSLVR